MAVSVSVTCWPYAASKAEAVASSCAEPALNGTLLDGETVACQVVGVAEQAIALEKVPVARAKRVARW